MSDQDDASKTEEPTAKRLSDARDKGDFAKAPELAATFTLAGAFGYFAFILPGKGRIFMEFSRSIFSDLAGFEVNSTSVTSAFRVLLLEGMAFLFPLAAAVSIGAVVAGGLQSGFFLSPKALEWKLDKLSPISGVKNLISSKKWVQFGVDLFKFAAIGSILAILIRGFLKDPVFHSPIQPKHLVSFIYETLMELWVYLIASLGAIAAVHLIAQKQMKMKDMRMSQQEVKDEHKNSEGDPMIKRARREMAMRLSQKQMLEEVPMADVIVTNPTHFAVALKYEQGKDMAPLILAKGKNRFAQKIKQIAKDNGVPMVENRPVAQMLYKFGRAGESIPNDLYRAVAEILSHVYRTHRYYFHQLRMKRQRRDRNG